jgi:acyl-lipid omega-6 desaturase (Delta-12 desaturase)
VLQWFSGNIGLHHIHHLRPRIPNYNLQKSFDETPELQRIEPLTLGKSLGCVWLNLWDESNRRMIGFRHLKAYRTVAQRS